MLVSLLSGHFRPRLVTAKHQYRYRTDCGHRGDRHQCQSETACLVADPAYREIKEEAGQVAQRIDLRQSSRGGGRPEPFRRQRPERPLAGISTGGNQG